MKKTVSLLVCMILLFALPSCKGGGEPANTSQETAADTSRETQTETQSLTEAKTAPQGMKWVGNTKFGFAIIPETLAVLDFEDEYIQFSDGGSIFITLMATDESDSDLDSYMEFYIGRLEDMGSVVTGPTKMPLGGIDALQLQGHFTDEDISFAAWAFQTDDGIVHRVAGEGSSSEINGVMEYLATSYTLELPEGAFTGQPETQKPAADETQQAGNGDICIEPGCNNKKDRMKDNYCAAHMCWAANCQNRKTGSSNYCAEHKCVESGCNSEKSWKTRSAYCDGHKCMVSNCGNRRISNSISYCAAHKCAEPNCRSERTYGEYCFAHRK